MFTKTKQRLRAGRVYDGPVAWSDDYTAVPRPGYYALSADGKHVLADVPIVCVDDAPGDPEDGACHYEYAGPKDYPQRRADGTRVEKGRTVDIEVEAEGLGGIEA